MFSLHLRAQLEPKPAYYKAHALWKEGNGVYIEYDKAVKFSYICDGLGEHLLRGYVSLSSVSSTSQLKEFTPQSIPKYTTIDAVTSLSWDSVVVTTGRGLPRDMSDRVTYLGIQEGDFSFVECTPAFNADFMRQLKQRVWVATDKLYDKRQYFSIAKRGESEYNSKWYAKYLDWGVTRKFGARTSVSEAKTRSGRDLHTGVDYSNANPHEIYPLTEGKVIVAKYLSGHGNAVVLEHKIDDSKVYYSFYAHLNSIDESIKGKTESDNIK